MNATGGVQFVKYNRSSAELPEAARLRHLGALKHETQGRTPGCPEGSNFFKSQPDRTQQTLLE